MSPANAFRLLRRSSSVLATTNMFCKSKTFFTVSQSWLVFTEIISEMWQNYLTPSCKNRTRKLWFLCFYSVSLHNFHWMCVYWTRRHIRKATVDMVETEEEWITSGAVRKYVTYPHPFIKVAVRKNRWRKNNMLMISEYEIFLVVIVL